MRPRDDGRGDWLAYALLTLRVLAWGALAFAAGVAWGISAPVCAAPVATPWVLLATWP